MLVKSAKSEQELQLALKVVQIFLSWWPFYHNSINVLVQVLFFKGTFAKDKNELLAQQFQINYDDEPAMFRKGCSVYREKVMLQMLSVMQDNIFLIMYCV